MFDNISKLRFVQGPAGEPIANAMISSEGEIMEYRQGVLAEGKVHVLYLHVKLMVGPRRSLDSTWSGTHMDLYTLYMYMYAADCIYTYTCTCTCSSRWKRKWRDWLSG